MQGIRLFFITLIAFLAFSPLAMAEDYIQCSEVKSRILCNLIIPDYIANVRSILTNGWENQIQINIALLDGSAENTIMRSRLEATQRCYLDPFESPCLILWKGASQWQKYRNETVFLTALEHFAIQALTLQELDPDNYIVRITVQVMPSAQKRLSSIRSWFKSGGDETGSGAWSTGSFIGSFLGSRAEAIEDDVTEITLETSQFYIDIGHEEAPKESAPEENTSSE